MVKNLVVPSCSGISKKVTFWNYYRDKYLIMSLAAKSSQVTNPNCAVGSSHLFFGSREYHLGVLAHMANALDRDVIEKQIREEWSKWTQSTKVRRIMNKI